MSKINFTKTLEAEYYHLYKNCEIKSAHFEEVDSSIEVMLNHKSIYEKIAQILHMPWYCIAVIHNMESGLNFSRHLHNGDSLTKRTIHVPENRPAKGRPPFTWEESAIDALKLRNLHRVRKWSLSRVLYEIEGYNGWGYRLYHKHVLSPYLWSYSNHYHSGKYIADGGWSDTAISKQCGAAVLLRRLEESDAITLDFSTSAQEEEYIFYYSETVATGADELQRFLNSFNGIVLRVDSWPGKKTSDAVKKVFGFYLRKDPRN